MLNQFAAVWAGCGEGAVGGRLLFLFDGDMIGVTCSIIPLVYRSYCNDDEISIKHTTSDGLAEEVRI